MVKKDWEDIGARVELITFDAGDLNQEVIRPRKYHALLFGEVVGRNPDLYAFWHSSQRLDPGLNVAQYANITADKLLEKTRNIEDRMERLLAYKELGAEMEKDIPAIFLYSPHSLVCNLVFVLALCSHNSNIGICCLFPIPEILD